MNQIQITLDGPAASGKSSLARIIAQRLGGFYVNTGDMYRALTMVLLQRGIQPESQPDAVPAVLAQVDIRYRATADRELILTIDGRDADMNAVRAPEVAAQVSFTARIPEVRRWLVDRQRESADLGLIVMEGRDIGTVVFPQARFKFYIHASAMVRARRRFAQSGEIPADATLERVAQEIAARDEMDMNRAISPLRPAADAIYIDSSELTLDQAVAEVLAHVQL